MASAVAGSHGTVMGAECEGLAAESERHAADARLLRAKEIGRREGGHVNVGRFPSEHELLPQFRLDVDVVTVDGGDAGIAIIFTTASEVSGIDTTAVLLHCRHSRPIESCVSHREIRRLVPQT